MALKGEKDKILEMIAKLPEQMEAADIHDFCSLALLYSAQTPYSYKRVRRLSFFFKKLFIIFAFLPRPTTKPYSEKKYRSWTRPCWSCRKPCACPSRSRNCSSAAVF